MIDERVSKALELEYASRRSDRDVGHFRIEDMQHQTRRLLMNVLFQAKYHADPPENRPGLRTVDDAIVDAFENALRFSFSIAPAVIFKQIYPNAVDGSGWHVQRPNYVAAGDELTGPIVTIIPVAAWELKAIKQEAPHKIWNNRTLRARSSIYGNRALLLVLVGRDTGEVITIEGTPTPIDYAEQFTEVMRLAGAGIDPMKVTECTGIGFGWHPEYMNPTVDVPVLGTVCSQCPYRDRCFPLAVEVLREKRRFVGRMDALPVGATPVQGAAD